MAFIQDGSPTNVSEHHLNSDTRGNNIDGKAAHSSKRVLIVGGGPVGCITALKLGQAGIDVDIVERVSTISDSPRAVGYYGAAQLFLNDIGMYELIRQQGFMTRGLCWRKKPTDDGEGGKELGDMLACQPLCALDDTIFDIGAGLLNLPQADLNKLSLSEALKTGHVSIHFNTELVSILHNSENGVSVLARNLETNEEKQYHANYLIGADGASSVTRKALGLPFPGHTWPERLISTNVYVKNGPDPTYHTHFVMDRIHYTIATPLENPIEGKTTLWRYTIAAHPDDKRPDDELMSDSEILQHYENVMSGPRPLQVEIKHRSVYRIHQRLAPTMRKGNCLLVGDAGHGCNPYGALGLNTGILDADAAAESLIMILNERQSSALLNIYSDERRKVFQFFVDPTSTANKLRVHSNSADTAVEDDWFFRMMSVEAPKMSPDMLQELARPYFETWRTNMRKFVNRV